MPYYIDYENILITENEIFANKQISNGEDAFVIFDKNEETIENVSLTNQNISLPYNQTNQIREMSLHADYGMMLNGSDGCYFFNDTVLHAPNNYFEIIATDGNNTWFAN